MRTLFLFALGLSLSACCSNKVKSTAPAEAPAAAAGILPQTIEQAVAGPYRRPENRARDVYRHPAATLNFFGLKPTMSVVEITPGAGWYSEILAPLLVSQGHYTAAVGGPARENTLGAWLALHPDVAAKAQTTVFDPAQNADVAPAGSADMVLTFRNVHNWMSKGTADAAFASFFRALKPGGILGVAEHRANPKHPADGKSGYVREKDIVRMAKKAGFKLVAKSEINANPRDTKDYPDGVWTLPPTLRLGDKDRARYLAIGESDRMTLKFVKP
jgi:predicted methyltransferase